MRSWVTIAAVLIVLLSLASAAPVDAQYYQFGVCPPPSYPLAQSYYGSPRPVNVYGWGNPYSYGSAYTYRSPVYAYAPNYFGATPYYNSPAATYYYYSYWYAPYNITPNPYPPYYTRGGTYYYPAYYYPTY